MSTHCTMPGRHAPECAPDPTRAQLRWGWLATRYQGQGAGQAAAYEKNCAHLGLPVDPEVVAHHLALDARYITDMAEMRRLERADA